MKLSAVSQGFLQLDDMWSQHDPHLRIIGGRRETLGGYIIYMLQNKGKNMRHQCSRYKHTNT